MPPIGNNSDCRFEIREVWEYNLEEEMATIREIVRDYPYLAMDTEFPGVVARPVGTFRSAAEFTFQTLRCNVDLLKIIQLGITFADEHGNVPKEICTWQFNFKFSLAEDMYAQDSIDLLTRSGINFKRFEAEGVDVNHFAELLIPSGIVLSDHVKWLSFHSGYDFAYLLKVLTCQNLPTDEMEFFNLLYTYFPCIYDIKYLMRSCKSLKGGLQEVGDDLDVERIGPQHQAGSDSMLTCFAFFKMRQVFFEDKIDDSKFMGHLYGLGTSYLNKSDGNGNANNTIGYSLTAGSSNAPPGTPNAGSHTNGYSSPVKSFASNVPSSPSSIVNNGVHGRMIKF